LHWLSELRLLYPCKIYLSFIRATESLVTWVKRMNLENDFKGLVSEMVACVAAENPMHKKNLELALARISAEESEQLGRYIAYCINSGLSIPYLVESYLTLVYDTLKEQIYFQKHGKYRHSCYEDVANDVYLNEQYMAKYMYGLALALYLWPGLLEIFRFFSRTLPRDKRGRYLEVGPGPGTNMMFAMQMTSYDSFYGIDISETSIKMTKSIIEYSLPKARAAYELERNDFLSAAPPHDKYACIVMGEVLEHVEQPSLFLRKITEMARDDAFIFVTTCINTPAIDHIYLFESTEQVAQMIRDSGLRIQNELVLPYEGMSLENCMKERLPVNVAYVLAKQ
jgi:2-polyprenyl-3-methyl-5-hydroxy-6-metoxy-1,4-benzoquinol methylase